MAKIKATETVILPLGITRFQDTQPGISEKYQEYRDAGKATAVPKVTEEIGDGLYKVVTTGIWNNRADYDEFVAWVKNNYTALKTEYYARNATSARTEVTIEDIAE